MGTGLFFGCGDGAAADLRGLKPDLAAATASSGSLPTLHAVEIHEPATLRSLQTELTGPDGAPVRILCASCHSLQDVGTALPENARAVGPPHQGLQMVHGDLACASCHRPEQPENLRLASGKPLAMTDALQLCAQCHGPQYRDYRHGAHGGMQGYWDLRRGGRIRNHCVDCHDPHKPKFPSFKPLPGPRDRFPPAGTESASHGTPKF